MKNIKNRVQLIGYLGMDPEVKTTQSGKTLARFSLATNENYRNGNGEKVTDTQWHKIVTWGKNAEISGKYLKKGKEVAVEGKLTTYTYEGKDDKKHYITEIVVDELLLLGPKS